MKNLSKCIKDTHTYIHKTNRMMEKKTASNVRPGINKQYWKWKQYAHMGVDSCISSHHRHYLHRARPWAQISMPVLCIMYTKAASVHTYSTHLLFTLLSLSLVLNVCSAFCISLPRCWSLCLCYLYKTKMKIHCVYTPHSIFMCKYLRALFFASLSCPISSTFFNLCCCFSFYYIFFLLNFWMIELLLLLLLLLFSRFFSIRFTGWL